MKKLFSVIFLSFIFSSAAVAQSFSSGSTGADGALDLSTMDCPNSYCLIQLPESGILNYTTINIPYGKTLAFKPNFRNTPVIMLAQGAVTISGSINIGGGCQYGNGRPGPGGFFAGATFGQNGFGPGGGTAASPNGRWVGSLSLVPIIGGSGGYSGGGFYGAGHGGGAIAIASSSSITMSGTIDARGGVCSSSSGAGGAIRLVANSVNISGTFVATGASGGDGVVRIEAPADALQYNGSSSPLAILSTTINPQVVSGSSTPSLRIISIGGYPVPYATGRPDSIDLMLPNSLADPVNIVVQAANIPVGTQISLNLSGPSGANYTPGVLSGTQDSSSATIPVSGLSRSGATFILAFAEYTLPPSVAQYNTKGTDQVAKVRVEAALDGKQKFVFLRGNGSAIEMARVPVALRKAFGQ